MPTTPANRKIIYVGDIGAPGTSTYRFMSLQRLGQQVVSYSPIPYLSKSPLLSKIRYRYPVGPLISRANRELVKMVKAQKPDVVWFDRPLIFTLETIREIKSAGALTVCYNQDNPFGPRNDGCWMQFYKIYRHIDLHCLLRTVDIPRYEQWGLPFVKVLLSYEPTAHFPPPAPWSDSDRTREVSFTGSPYDDRPEFLRALAETHKVPVLIAGGGWQKIPNAERYAKYVTHPAVLGADYREMIWKSKINLAFVTQSNEEDVGHKSFEITACASFLLALRTPGHLEAFEEDKEAVYFSSIEECADKCRFYLRNPEARQAIALRGRERASKSGYDNDAQLRKILLKLDGIEEPVIS